MDAQEQWRRQAGDPAGQLERSPSDSRQQPAAKFTAAPSADARRQQSAASGSSSAMSSDRDESSSNSADRNWAPSSQPAAARLDKMRALEALLMERVGASAMAARQKDFERALKLARQASEALGRLRALNVQLDNAQQVQRTKQNSASSITSSGALAEDLAAENVPASHETRPLSGPSGASLFELLVMVKSNLACQLRNCGQLSESLELYTQLCKLATSSNATGGSTQAQSSGRLLLHKFGLNVGNVLLEMGDIGRALKHYRLTLDRLASSASAQLGDHTNLRLKLQANIAVALMRREASSDHQSQRTRAGLTLAPSEQRGALERLLASNLKQQQQVGSQAQQRQRATPLNANHHKFGLNLMACYHSELDARAARALLNQLVCVDICEHFERVAARPRARDSASGELAAAASRVGESQQDERQVPAADKLELLICAREAEVARALLAACRLLVELCANKQPQPPADQSRDLNGGSAALTHCLRLLTAAGQYRSLALELWANNVVSSLTGRWKLRAAMRSLLELVRLGQRAARAVLAGRAPGGAPPPHNFMSASNSAAQTTFVLLQLLTDQVDQAKFKLTTQTSQNGLSATNRIQLANCHALLGDARQAEVNYEQALDAPNATPATCWLAHCNLIALAARDGRHLDDLPMSTRNFVNSSEVLERAPLPLKRLSFIQTQLARLYHNSNLQIQAVDSLKGRDGALVAPELSLDEASRMLEQADGRTPAIMSAAIGLLQKARKLHAYHVGLAERLVALLISQFEFGQAELVLLDCVRNRSHEARWLQLLAECFRRAADYKRAMRVYQHASERFPTDSNCLRALIKLADELGLAEERDRGQARLNSLQAAHKAA